MLSVEAVVLHRRPYRETSFLVDIFSRQTGKISAVAKGGRSAKSERKSLLQPFQLLSLQLHGRHELRNLGSVDAIQPSQQLHGQALYCAMYLNELLNRLLPREEPCEQLFDHYLNTLQALSDSQGQLKELEPMLREFEFALLAELGYLPDLESDEQGEPLTDSLYYAWNEEQGLYSTQQRTKSWPGSDILDVAQRNWTATSLTCAKQLSRLLLAPLLGSKPLKSRELFAPYRATLRSD